jgi:branched-chain amino acid transport system permease protein
VLFTAVVGFVLAVVLGAVSLRVGGIAFAMVTLAFAQAGSILVLKNPYGWTGGEEGFGVDYLQLPTWAVGIFNTKNLYWLALGYAAAVFAIVRWAVNSSPGHVWQAIRENELRVQVLGLKPYTYKLMSFVLASMLATAGGIVYLLLLGGANTQVTTASFTLTLLLMVVLGGTGSRWGAMIGGILYTYADHRLGDLSSSSAVSDLPSIFRTPLQQPLFILGVLFILVVFFVPGGLTRIGQVGVRLDRILRKPAVQEEVS